MKNYLFAIPLIGIVMASAGPRKQKRHWSVSGAYPVSGR